MIRFYLVKIALTVEKNEQDHCRYICLVLIGRKRLRSALNIATFDQWKAVVLIRKFVTAVTTNMLGSKR